MAETILFCCVFLGQVLLISWFYPRRVIQRSRYVLQHFPPATHPKLYPQSPERYERWLRNVARVNLVIVVAGVVIIALILGALAGVWSGGIFAPAAKGEWAKLLVAPFFVLQFVAGVGYLQVSAGKLLRAMAGTPPPRVRTAELHRRRLVDFVSAKLLLTAALTNAAFIGFVLYCYERFELPRFKAVAAIASAAVVLLVFGVNIAIVLRARKIDPYQADADRRKAIKLVVQQALGFCIAYPVLFAALLIIGVFEPELLEPVLVSLFC